MPWPISASPCQPADDLAFERIVNTPQARARRGHGAASSHDHARAAAHPADARPRARLAETDELKPKPRTALSDARCANFARWSTLLDTTPHTELGETILDESGYTEMWQADRSAEAPGRLENLKELIRSMEEFESLRGFLEHVALVMDAEQNADADAVSIMTLHSAKGLEFETVFLPGWEEGLFPHQRSLDEGGRSGLEEERRLAYVGITRAQKRALHLVRLEPAHPRPLAVGHPVALPRRTAETSMSTSPKPARPTAATARTPTAAAPAASTARPFRQHLFDRPAGSAPRRTRRRRSRPAATAVRPNSGHAHDRRRTRGKNTVAAAIELFNRRAYLPSEIRLRPDLLASTATS